MGVVISPDSEIAREMQKWEQFPRYNTNGELIPAGNPYVFRPYPKMLYKAFERPNGKVECMTLEPNPRFYKDPNDYDFALREANAFTKECQHIVKSADEEKKASEQGWRETPKDAVDYFNGLKDDMARAAAEAAFTAKGMSEKARAEYDALTDATHEHVVDVRGTKKGAQAVTGKG